MSNFSIGIYQSQSLLNLQGPPIPPPQGTVVGDLNSIWAVTWYSIRDPENVVHIPPPMVGTDLYGAPAVRGWAQMQWNYSQMHPEQWYMFYWMWRTSRNAVGPNIGHVYIQWPDPLSGIIQQASARWQKPSQVSRDVPQFHGVQLLFTHLGIDDPYPPTGTWEVTS